MHNLLEDPLIRVRLMEGEVGRVSLPALYAALAEDHVLDFPALRPHQRHAWHAFLAQLATVAIDRAGDGGVPQSASRWGSLLRELTPQCDADEPWRLVVEDPRNPAFMQPPAPSGLADYRKSVDTPDDLDLLVTSKNHDVKQSVALAGAPEDWIFALVDLQTMSGFLGAGNYGIARMNGGFSSRPCLGLSPVDGGVGAHVFHDVRRMLADRQGLLKRMTPYFRPRGGLSLLWLEPWNGTNVLDLRDLDPYFIEVCRRVRLVREGGALAARTAPTRKARIDAKAAKGNLGDFWTPVDVKDQKALSLPASGFNYKRLSALLFDKRAFEPPAAMRAGPERGGQWRVVARAIASGQGKTEGYHERTDIRFSPEVARSLIGGTGRDRLAKLAEQQIGEINAVGDALRFAAATAASGGKPPGKLGRTDRAQATPFLRRLEAVADARFFETLEKRYLAIDDDSRQAHRGDFVKQLVAVARRLLDEAIRGLPCPAIRRHRARAKALDTFDWRLREAGKGPLADLAEALRARGESP